MSDNQPTVRLSFASAPAPASTIRATQAAPSDIFIKIALFHLLAFLGWWLMNAWMDKPFVDMSYGDPFSGTAMVVGIVVVAGGLFVSDALMLELLSKKRSVLAISLFLIVAIAVFLPDFGNIIYSVGDLLITAWNWFWHLVFTIFLYIVVICLLPGFLVVGGAKSLFGKR